MMRGFWCLVLMWGVLGSASAVAAQAPDPASKLSSDKPIEITSDTLEVFQEENRAVFIGNVVAIQGEMRLKAEKMIVFYKQPAEGADTQPQGDAIQKIEVEGNVFLSTPEETASGSAGVYDVANKNIVLTQNVVLTREKNTLKGDKLVYNMATGKSMVTSGGVARESGKGGQRVRALFIPDKKEGQKDPQNGQ